MYLHQSNSVSKTQGGRLVVRTLAALILAACVSLTILISMLVVSARNGRGQNDSQVQGQSLSQSQEATCCLTQAQNNPLPLAVFNPAGLRATIDSAIANKAAGYPLISVKVSSRGQQTLSGLEVLLLDVAPDGKLISVQGKHLAIQIQPREQREIYFATDTKHDQRNSFVLTIKSLMEESAGQDIEADDLETISKRKVTTIACCYGNLVVGSGTRRYHSKAQANCSCAK
jgi:hypothetical protein